MQLVNVEASVRTKITRPTFTAQNSTAFIPFRRQAHACTLCLKVTGNAHAWTLFEQHMRMFDTRLSRTSMLTTFRRKIRMLRYFNPKSADVFRYAFGSLHHERATRYLECAPSDSHENPETNWIHAVIYTFVTYDILLYYSVNQYTNFANSLNTSKLYLV